MSWNKYQENILKNWSSTSKTYSIMHSISAQYYNNWNKRLGIPVILLGATASSSIFTTSTENDVNNIWSYVNGGLVLLMTGISGLSKFLGLTEKHVKHTSASFKYTNISMNIDTLLSFPRRDRTENPRQFINEIKMAILEVREHSPNLPTWVVSNYIHNLDKSIINTQTRVNRTDGAKININNQDQYSSLRKLNNWNNSYNKDSEYNEKTKNIFFDEKPVDDKILIKLPTTSDNENIEKVSEKPDDIVLNITKNENTIEVENKRNLALSPMSPMRKKYTKEIKISPEKNYNSDENDGSIYTDFIDPFTEKMSTIADKLQYNDSDSE